MADRFDHRCGDGACPLIGQLTSKSCGCHETREQMMLAHTAQLEAALSQLLKATQFVGSRVADWQAMLKEAEPVAIAALATARGEA